MGCNNCSEDKDLDKAAFTIFVRALLSLLKENEGVVVEGFAEGETYIVWHNPLNNEIIINENRENVPIGSLVKL